MLTTLSFAEIYKSSEKEGRRYFFTSKPRKFKGGKRPERTAKDGFWKATGTEHTIKIEGKDVVGCKCSLKFVEGLQGDPKHQKQTPWLMQEYTIPKHRNKIGENNLILDDHVLCKIYLSDRCRRNNESYESNGNVINEAATNETDGECPAKKRQKRSLDPGPSSSTFVQREQFINEAATNETDGDRPAKKRQKRSSDPGPSSSTSTQREQPGCFSPIQPHNQQQQINSPAPLPPTGHVINEAATNETDGDCPAEKRQKRSNDPVPSSSTFVQREQPGCFNPIQSYNQQQQQQQHENNSLDPWPPTCDYNSVSCPQYAEHGRMVDDGYFNYSFSQPPAAPMPLQAFAPPQQDAMCSQGFNDPQQQGSTMPSAPNYGHTPMTHLMYFQDFNPQQQDPMPSVPNYEPTPMQQASTSYGLMHEPVYYSDDPFWLGFP